LRPNIQEGKINKKRMVEKMRNKTTEIIAKTALAAAVLLLTGQAAFGTPTFTPTATVTITLTYTPLVTPCITEMPTYAGGWQKILGGSGTDVGNSVQQTTDGGYIIAGYTDSFGAGSNDAYLVKTDAGGNLSWQKTFGGSGNEQANSVRQTSDGGYIFAGSTDSYGAGVADMYIVKTDAGGNLSWSKTFGGVLNDTANSVQQTSDGGYIIAGTEQLYPPPNSTYMCLVKTDASGNCVWTRTYGYGNDEGYSAQQTNDGGYIVAGKTYNGGGDVYLVKTDSSGIQTWENRFGGAQIDNGYSVQQTTDGGYIIAGSTTSYGAGILDYYLIKTDAGGNQSWYKTFGCVYSDEAHSVQQTSDGGYIVGGTLYLQDGASHDAYLVKTDAAGNIVWQRSLGNTNAFGNFVQQTSDGGYVVTGSIAGPVSVDVLLAKLDLNGNVMAAATPTPPASLTPTPDTLSGRPVIITNNVMHPLKGETVKLRYRVDEPSDVEITVCDRNGKAIKTLFRGNKDAGDYDLEWTGDSDSGRKAGAGFYIIKIKIGGFKTTEKAAIIK
jgi:hypothetical protein